MPTGHGTLSTRRNGNSNMSTPSVCTTTLLHSNSVALHIVYEIHLFVNKNTKTRALRECKPPPMPNFQPEVIQDSDLDCRINPDLYVCRICPKMWMHSIVGVSHFAKYGTNQPLIVWEMLRNVKKSPIPQWWRWRKWKSDPESTCGSGSPPKVNHF